MIARECPDLALEWAVAAWNKFNLTLPVDPHRLRKGLGLYIKRKAVNYPGCLLSTPKRWYIVINSYDPPERQRFTMAHECAEYCLMRYREKRGLRPAEGQEKERFCDRFAVNLLMPEDQVRRMAGELYHAPKNDKSEVLAARFGVSVQAMRIRLDELGLRKKRK